MWQAKDAKSCMKQRLHDGICFNRMFSVRRDTQDSVYVAVAV